MAEETYNYDISTIFGTLNARQFAQEVAADPVITKALARIDTSGATPVLGVLSAGQADVVFKDALTGGEQTALAALVTAHQARPRRTANTALPAGQAALVQGTSGIVDSGRRQGYVGTSAAAAKALLASSYFFQGAGAQRSLKSLNAADTGGGTGARKVRITYYDGSMNGPFTEDVTLNGGTVATVATNIRHVEKLEVIEVGSGGGNAGTIQMFDDNAGAGGLITSLLAGDNRTYHAQHFVAADRVCFVTEAQIGSVVNPGVMTLNAQNPNDATSPQQNADVSFPYPAQRSLNVPFKTPIRVVGPARVWMVVNPSAASADTVHGAFGFFEVQK